MRFITNLLLAISIMICLLSCNNDDDNYPKTGIEKVKKPLPAYYFDVENITDYDIDNPIIIHSKLELEKLFYAIDVEIPVEIQDLSFKDESFIFVSHLTKYKDIKLNHNLSYKIPAKYGNYYYKYEITELFSIENGSNEEAKYRYYSGVVIKGIFNSSKIELLFKDKQVK